MKKFTKISAGICIAIALTTSAFAADTAVKASAVQSTPSSDSWTLTLGGSGTTTTKGDSQTAFGVEVGIGRTGNLLFPIETGVRQSIGYASGNGGNTVFGTKLYNDWTVLKVKSVDVFAGGNAGATYGNVPLEFSAAPEAGLRWWLKKDVAVVGRIEYPFSLNSGKAADKLDYSLAFQVKF